MTALVELATLVNDRRKVVPGGRLILRVGLAAHEVLTAASVDAGHGSQVVPAIPVAEGQGLSYRQVEIEVDRDGGSAWALLDGGEIVGSGTLS